MVNPRKREKSRNRYSEGLKRKIAKEYLSGRASYGILAEEHNLVNKGVVKEFVKWYKRQLELSPLKEIQVKDSGKSQENQDLNLSDLEKEKEVKGLREKLALSELKCEMLETMIEEAEKALSIDIRKKSGTNQ